MNKQTFLRVLKAKTILLPSLRSVLPCRCQKFLGQVSDFSGYTWYKFSVLFCTSTDFLLTVDLLRSCICEKHAHHLLEVAAGLGRVAVLAHVVQHSLQDVVQRGSRLIQQDSGPGQEAVQVPVCPDFLLKVHQLHILWRRLHSFKVGQRSVKPE